MNKTMTKMAGIKGFEGGIALTDEQLRKINGYALKELKAEEVYVRKYLLAHNAVDRDRERFPDGMLDDFANTLPGKSLLFAHDRRSYLPMGLFFDASTEAMSPEQFKALTGEAANLPPDIASVKVLWSWFYMLKSAGNQELMDNIDAGIYRHASIGFAASDLIAVKGQYQDTLYYEYVQPGEALEGSIVWLGAQPGATAQKAADKSAVTFSPTTAAPEGTAWDADAAKGRIARWASSDGSGAKEKMDWGKYRKGFAWYDGENPENFGAYKLPHHDVIEGRLSVVWQGVASAMAALLGARGGVDIPQEDKDSVYEHLSRHYSQFDREAPAKAFTGSGVNIINHKPKEGSKMTKVKTLLGLSDDASEDSTAKALGEKLTRLKSLETIAEAVGEDATVESVKTLKSQSEDGKTYRKSLVDDAVKYGALVGEIKSDAESQKKEAEFIATWPIDRIKELKEKNEAKARKQFPDKFSISSKDEKDRLKAAEEAEKAARTTGKKDYTDPKHNELFETVKM